MDFNTGTGGSGGSPSGPSSPPPRTSGVAASGEFTYQDPVQSFISTVQRVVLQPVDFYRGMLRRGDFINPLIFAIICYEVSAILGGIIALAFGARGFGGFISTIILGPIIAAVVLFIWAGLIYLLVMLIVGSRNGGYEATFRVFAYAAVTQLVSWLSAIPILGILISIAVAIFGVFLSVVGIREVHTTTTGKAALVVLIPVGVLALLGIVLALIVGAFLFNAMNAQ
jgi:hypothetical protein